MFFIALLLRLTRQITLSYINSIFIASPFEAKQDTQKLWNKFLK